MHIREATEKDFEVMLEVQLATVATLTDTYPAADLAAWEKRLREKGEKRYAPLRSLVYIENDKVVGFVSWEMGDVVWLKCLYVLPEFTGKGIGSELLKQAEAKILKDKHVPVRVKSSLNARPFYERHGYKFVEMGKSQADFDVAIMEKFEKGS